MESYSVLLKFQKSLSKVKTKIENEPKKWKEQQNIRIPNQFLVK